MVYRTQIVAIAFLLCWFIIPSAALAGNFDGSRELVCAAMQTAACGYGSDCITGTAEDVDFPTFIRINVKKKTISATEEFERDVVTKIKNIKRTEGRLILQGVEQGRGWSLSLSETTGKMVMTASGDGEGFVVFGECTTR